MIYRQISVARAMRLIALGQTKNLYFQNEKNNELGKVDRFTWETQEFTQRIFFELEEGQHD